MYIMYIESGIHNNTKLFAAIAIIIPPTSTSIQTQCGKNALIFIFQEIAFSFNPSARILQPNDLTYPISYTVNTTEIFIKDINSTQHARIMISSSSEYSVS